MVAKEKLMTSDSSRYSLANLSQEVLIREAILDDAQPLSSLYNFYVKSSTATFAVQEETAEERRAWLLHHEARKMPVFVADLNGRVLGFASVSPYHDRCAYAGTCELSVYVDPNCLGKGLGKALIDRLMEHCRTRYHAVLALICSENDASLKLFASRGFKQVGRLQEVGYKFDRYLDVSILQLILPNSNGSKR